MVIKQIVSKISSACFLIPKYKFANNIIKTVIFKYISIDLDACVGASVTVMAVLTGKPETLAQYRIYTKSVGKMIKLPRTYNKEYDMTTFMDKLNWPLTAMVKVLNTQERVLDIDRVSDK